MVKLFAPAMSIDATGTVGDAMTFSKWKGRHYLRKKSTPGNPRTGLQVGIRAMFKFITQNWDARSSAEKATWGAPALQTSISAFNAWLAENVKRWKRFQPPGIQYPIGNTGTVGAFVPIFPRANNGVRSITIQVGYMGINDNWGGLIFKGSTGFSTALGNCVAVILADALFTDYFWLNTPLEPGTHYYNYRSFTLDGAIGPETGEFSGVASA